MNTSQLAMQQQENDEWGQEAREDVLTYEYNLIKHPIKQKETVCMTQTGHFTGVEGNIMTIYSKHMHTSCCSTVEKSQ